METPSVVSSEDASQRATKLLYFGNELPGDDIAHLFRQLQQNSKSKRHRYLATFLEEASAIFREEVTKLPQYLKDGLLSYKSVLGLADIADLARHPVGGAVESVILCVSELASLIGHFERSDLPFSLAKNTTTLCGLSIGLLAAAAVSASSSLADLALIGAEAVRVSFRLGIRVGELSRSIELQEADQDLIPWAYVVTDLSVESVRAEIDRYNADTANSNITKILISAADKTSVSVTGPPSRLKDAFRHSQVLRYSKHVPLPVYSGICHAPHLYDSADVDWILEPTTQHPLCCRSQAKLTLLSTQTGRPFRASTATGLLTQVCAEILTGTIQLDEVVNGILDNVSVFGRAECEVLHFGNSLILRNFLKSINEELPEVAVEQVNLTKWLTSLEASPSPRTPRESKLAIVGMSCRLPGGANDLELFWKIMEEGRDVHTTIPEDRFDINTHLDPSGNTPNATETPYGNFIDNPGMFDAGFFNMSPKEAEQTDPMHRLALVTAYEALEMAGYAPNRTPSTMLGRIGTFYGQASDDWREVNAGQNIGTYAVPGGERAFANGRINYFFKFGGPSFNIDTACSSGLAAVNAACSALWAGEADTVIAGGLSVITNPDNYAMLCQGHFLSKTGQCKVWDSGADGYCRADGIGSVVIKRLEDAEADNDNIIATICAAATNHSANAASITQPHAGAQKDNYKQVLLEAGISPLDVTYVELHGTGTQVGDAIESESVAEVFAPLRHSRRADQRLHLGAVKSNIGHGEAAAGIASLLKALLVYQKSQIPPHRGIIHEMNPVVAKLLEKRNAGLVMENTPWLKPQEKKRYALVNSFGAHGGNTTLLLEDAPEKLRRGFNDRPAHPLIVSAKSKNSLKSNLERLIQYLDQNPDTDLGDLSYTLCARRIHHGMRVGTAVSNVGQLRKFLESSLENVANARPTSAHAPSTIFAFTGQGASYKGISAELFHRFPFYREQITDLDRHVRQLGFPSVIPIVDGSVEDDSSPLVSQLSVVVIEIALARLWVLFGITPSAVIGHSLGEYAAMVVAGVVSATDAIYLAGKRCELMIASCQAGTHNMLSVRASVQAIEQTHGAANAEYEISCINGPEDTVISGEKDNIAKLRATLEEAGYKCALLKLPYAFHTAQLDPILPLFEKLAKHVSFKAPNVPFISPLLSSCVFDGKTLNGKYLRDASRQAVNFVGALEAAQDMGIADSKTIWLDIGPHPVCGNLIRSSIAEARVVASLRRGEDNFTTIPVALATLHTEGVPVCWNEYYRPVEQSLQLLTLPSYSWNEKNYWIPYVGTWTLDKAFPENASRHKKVVDASVSPFRTSSIHQIIFEEVSETEAKVTASMDIMHPDLLASIKGHTMNGYGVATSSIWADMALTVSEYLRKRISPNDKAIQMNLTCLEVLHAQIAHVNQSVSQMLQVQATYDVASSAVTIKWYDESGISSGEHYASATVRFEDAAVWSTEWNRMGHLVNGRIESLQRMASEGKASRLSSNMAYTLFKNVVDYADKYRGMQSVVIDGHEAFANITLVPETHGTWHTPPHWIDSVFHLGGFVLNGSDASNTKDYFFVTPGWESYRLMKSLQGGANYRSYVRMFPTTEANMYSGDVYVLQDEMIIGMMGQMKFRKVPRILMDKFFSPSDLHDNSQSARQVSVSAVKTTGSAPLAAPLSSKSQVTTSKMAAKSETRDVASTISSLTPQQTAQHVPEAVVSVPTPTTKTKTETGMIANCMKVIARETGLDPSELTDEASFVELGVDSLMSLVLSEKFKTDLNLDVKSSLFIECPNIKELKMWLEDYC